MQTKKTVYEQRGYLIISTKRAKEIALESFDSDDFVTHELEFGLPEVDDRYHVWRVPILDFNSERLGELVIDAKTGQIDTSKSTDYELIIKKATTSELKNELDSSSRKKNSAIARSQLRNTIIQGDAELTLAELPAESVDLVFTSPPYFNARPDYTEYAAYEEYLSKMRRVIQQCHRLLSEGRFIVFNVSPVLIRRTNRSTASKRIAVPFDLHRIFIEEGFDFIDDIIWEKPSGAGWATGRGRRFAADRNPLQYKAVPVTEYLLVYRKHTDRLIDWNIRNHLDQDAVARSKVADGYETTNIWRLPPAYSKNHPAIFPVALAERVIRYYSFIGDVVLDPFAGSGTLGQAAVQLDRRFVLSELDPEYVQVIRNNATKWLGNAASEVLCIGCADLPHDTTLF